MNTMCSELLFEQYFRSLKRNTYYKAWRSWLKRRVREIKEKTVHLFKDHSECWLFMMKHALLYHSCHDMKKFCTIKFSDNDPYEPFTDALKSAYRRTSIGKRLEWERQTVHKGQLWLKVNENEGFRTDQWILKARWLQRMERAGCFSPICRLNIYLYKLLGKNVSGAFKHLSKSVAPESRRKHLWTDGVYLLGDTVRARAKETYDWIEDGDIVLIFVKSAWLCGYDVPTLQHYGSIENKVILKKRWEKDMVSVYMLVLF